MPKVEEKGVMLHQNLTKMQSWEHEKVPQVDVESRDAVPVYKASLEA